MSNYTCLYRLLLIYIMITVETTIVPSKFRKLPNCGTNKALAGFTFMVINVRNKIQCTDLCAKTKDCVSVNIGRNVQKSLVCELNKQFVKFPCSRLAYRAGFDHYDLTNRIIYPTSCKSLRNSDPTLASGVYYVKPNDNVDAFKVCCNMDVAGGGWTLVYSYRFVDLTVGFKPARLSVWPTWPRNGETPKSTTVPLSDLDEGAMEFDLWKEIGEEFLTTSTVINWYACAPAATNGGSLTGWRDGDLDCSVAKVEITGTGCDDIVPVKIFVHDIYDPYLYSNQHVRYKTVIFWDGQSDKWYPAHDPCGKDADSDLHTKSNDPRGAIYVR